MGASSAKATVSQPSKAAAALRPDGIAATHAEGEVVISLTDKAGADAGPRVELSPEAALKLAYALQDEVAAVVEEEDLDPVAVIAAARGVDPSEVATEIVASNPQLVQAVREADEEAARGEFLTLEEALAEDE